MDHKAARSKAFRDELRNNMKRAGGTASKPLRVGQQTISLADGLKADQAKAYRNRQRAARFTRRNYGETEGANTAAEAMAAITLAEDPSPHAAPAHAVAAATARQPVVPMARPRISRFGAPTRNPMMAAVCSTAAHFPTSSATPSNSSSSSSSSSSDLERRRRERLELRRQARQSAISTAGGPRDAGMTRGRSSSRQRSTSRSPSHGRSASSSTSSRAPPPPPPPPRRSLSRPRSRFGPARTTTTTSFSLSPPSASSASTASARLTDGGACRGGGQQQLAHQRQDSAYVSASSSSSEDDDEQLAARQATLRLKQQQLGTASVLWLNAPLRRPHQLPSKVGYSCFSVAPPPQSKKQTKNDLALGLGGGNHSNPTAKLHVGLKSAASLRNAQLLGKQDPFVRLWCSHTPKGQQADSLPHTNAPKVATWNETFVFPNVNLLLVSPTTTSKERATANIRGRKKKDTYQEEQEEYNGGYLVVDVRNYNGSVLPSDRIGIGCFPLSQVLDRPNDEVVELYHRPKSSSKKAGAFLFGSGRGGGDASSDDVGGDGDGDGMGCELAGRVRLSLQLVPLTLNDRLSLATASDEDGGGGRGGGMANEGSSGRGQFGAEEETVEGEGVEQRLKFQAKERRVFESEQLSRHLTTTAAMSFVQEEEEEEEEEGEFAMKEGTEVDDLPLPPSPSSQGVRLQTNFGQVAQSNNAFNENDQDVDDEAADVHWKVTETRRRSDGVAFTDYASLAEASLSTLGLTPHLLSLQPPPPPQWQGVSLLTLTNVAQVAIDSPDRKRREGRRRGGGGEGDSQHHRRCVAEVPSGFVQALLPDWRTRLAEAGPSEEDQVEVYGTVEFPLALTPAGAGAVTEFVECCVRIDSLTAAAARGGGGVLGSEGGGGWDGRGGGGGGGGGVSDGEEGAGAGGGRWVAVAIPADSMPGDVLDFTLEIQTQNQNSPHRQQQHQQRQHHPQDGGVQIFSGGALAEVATASTGVRRSVAIIKERMVLKKQLSLIKEKESDRRNEKERFGNNEEGDGAGVKDDNDDDDEDDDDDGKTGSRNVPGGGGQGRGMFSRAKKIFSYSSTSSSTDNVGGGGGTKDDNVRMPSQTSRHSSSRLSSSWLRSGGSQNNDGDATATAVVVSDNANAVPEFIGGLPGEHRETLRMTKVSSSSSASSSAAAAVARVVVDHTESYQSAKTRAEKNEAQQQVAIDVWKKVDDFLQDLQATEGLSLRQLFNELDLNKDNTVTPREFLQRVSKGHKSKWSKKGSAGHAGISHLSGDEMAVLMKELDPQGLGVILYGDFSRTLRMQRKVIKLKDDAAHERLLITGLYEDEVLPEHGGGGHHEHHHGHSLRAGLESGNWEASAARQRRKDDRKMEKHLTRSRSKKQKKKKKAKEKRERGGSDSESGDGDSASLSSSPSSSASASSSDSEDSKPSKKPKKPFKKSKEGSRNSGRGDKGTISRDGDNDGGGGGCDLRTKTTPPETGSGVGCDGNWIYDPAVPRRTKQIWRAIEKYVDARHAVDGAKLVTMFREFDKDKDGCLSAVELKEGLHGVGIKINSRDFGLLLKDIDISGDGKIQFGEFSVSVLENGAKYMKKTGQRADKALL